MMYLILIIKIILAEIREVAEWLKAHAWKACRTQVHAGSNPVLSAKFKNNEH